MRSLEEIRFRITQEVANAWLWRRNPAPRLSAISPLPGLPAPQPLANVLRGTEFYEQVLRSARRMLEHRFPILGIEIETAPEIRWRRDYVNGRESGSAYFRRIPYLDCQRAGDHKIIWELNRHQHLVLLAQAWTLSGDRKFLTEIEAQIESWLDQNPFQCGINWTSALEVAFRSLSWVWTWHLAGSGFTGSLRERFLTALFHHGYHLEYNLSFYFSPNTHLLGEAVALHTLGALFPEWPRSSKWLQIGASTVRTELDRQVLPDGAHFELSSYYHVYALDFFLLHYLLAGRPKEFESSLIRMAAYLDMLLGVPRAIPFFGDDDGGRLFHPYGAHNEYGRATIATASAALGRTDWLYGACDLQAQAVWWLGEAALSSAPQSHSYVPQSRVFRESGLVELSAGNLQVLFDAGPFGARRAGHSHSDTLSLVVRKNDKDILIDPGTYTYVGDPEWRNRFRGSAAHNTLRVDERDQGTPAGPFGWLTKPEAALIRYVSAEGAHSAVGECRYDDLVLRRSCVLLEPEHLLFVFDEVEGDSEHVVEQFWHFGSEDACLRLRISPQSAIEPVDGWRSRALGQKEPAPVRRVKMLTRLPARLAAVLDLSDSPTPEASMQWRHSPDGFTATYLAERETTVRFSSSGTVTRLSSR